MTDQYIKSIGLKKELIPDMSKYPFCLPAVSALDDIELHPKVTYFVGENGTGKSTILEAVATAYGFNPEGGSRNFSFSTKESHSDLYRSIKIIKGCKRPRDGYFLRAESFYNVASNIEELDAEPGLGSPILAAYGGISLHEQSHGESFFALFQNRLRGKGLYILDEPEAALSPSRQMSLVARMHDLINMDSQFIIATHSPIIMGYPDSFIYEIGDGISRVTYEETGHFQIMKAFINNRDKMLRELMLSE
ncbi:MAG TPA: AAA family ATPase [Clostridia bacterium]|nr:AAA family ATPase [Clostridia bacterium]